MKVVAICGRTAEGELPFCLDERGNCIGELEEGSEYQVAKVEIGKSHSDVWIELPDRSEARIVGPKRFELVLEAHCWGWGERRVPFDIVGDLLQERGLYSREEYHRWTYSDDMPLVTTSYVVL